MRTWGLMAIAVFVLTLAGVQGYLFYSDKEGPTPEYVKLYSETTDGKGALEVRSGTYLLDRQFQSMLGPNGNLPDLKLSKTASEDDIVWLTGIESQMVSSETDTPVSPEFFCHANLTLSPGEITPKEHNDSFEPVHHLDWRIFTLVPGRMNIQLPEGFGIPVRNSSLLDYYSMALNQSGKNPGSVRIKSVIQYSKGLASKAMRPLFRRALYVYQKHREELPDAGLAKSSESSEHPGLNCALSCELDLKSADLSKFSKAPKSKSQLQAIHPGASCCVMNASEGGVMEQFGADHTIHWMAPPGRHSFRSNVSPQLDLPFDTTAHYVTGHLHPFGVSLQLIDLDNNEVVFEIVSEDYNDRLGVKEMSEIRLPEGKKIRKNGNYELVAIYDNPNSEPSDVMAILYIYFAEKSPTELVGEKLSVAP